MNDFLTRLAARALAPQPAIQPRTGSRFEPPATPPGSAGPLRTARNEDLALEEPLEIESRADDRRPLLSVPPKLKTELPALPNDDAPRDRFAPVAPAVRLSPALPNPPVVAVPAATVPPLPSRAEVVPAKAPAAAAAASRKGIESRSQPEEASAGSLRPAMPEQRRKPADDDALADPATSATHRAQTTRRAEGAPPVRQPFAPAVVAAPVARSEPAAATRSLPHETPPPTIRVTIGRIDVRAIAPSPAAATASRPGPAAARLSLEDYLQRRSGGRR
jgi:hypothetical protein